MARLSGLAGVRPSRPASLVTVIVGVGMLITAAMFFLNPFAGIGAFIVVWLIALVSIIGFHAYNAISSHGAHHTQVDFDINHDGGERTDFADQLRTLEQLKRDGLLSDAEFQKKRSEIMQAKW
jgi:hypothetical protein